MILIDTDVIMDVFFSRTGFENDSKMIFEICEKERSGVVTPVICANLNYFLTKEFGKKRSIEILKSLLTFLSVIDQNEKSVISALESDFTDFEDALQHFAATENGKVQAIITRNTKDYKHSEIPVFTPTEFITQLDV